MTVINLLEALKDELENITKDLMLEVKTKKGEEKAIKNPVVYIGQLPNKTDTTQYVPYILIKALTGEDAQVAGQMPSSECKTRIIVVTYSENSSVGYIDVLNVIDRIRIRLLKERIIAGQYDLQLPLDYIVYEDDLGPYTIGEMIVNWDMPTIQREVKELWQQ